MAARSKKLYQIQLRTETTESIMIFLRIHTKYVGKELLRGRLLSMEGTSPDGAGIDPLLSPVKN